MRFATFFPRGGSLLGRQVRTGLSRAGHMCIQGIDNDMDYTLISHHIIRNTEQYGDIYKGIEKITNKIILIDGSEWGYWTHIPEAAIQYYSIFSDRSIQRKPEQGTLRDFLKGKSYPYFRREFYKNVQYPRNYHPLDYHLDHNDLHTQAPSYDQFMNRKYDITMRSARNNSGRRLLLDIVNKMNCKQIVTFTKLKREPMKRELMTGRSSFVHDGYGSSSFREREVLVRCALFMTDISIEQRDPLTDGNNVIRFDMEYKINTPNPLAKTDNTIDGNVVYTGSNIKEKMEYWFDDKDGLYNIYRNGYVHCRKYYTQLSTAKYILDTIQKHDWTVTTEQEVSFK